MTRERRHGVRLDVEAVSLADVADSCQQAGVGHAAQSPWLRAQPIQRLSSFLRRTVRWKLIPQVSLAGLKFSVRNGISTSSVHPISLREARPVQMPSHWRLLTLPAPCSAVAHQPRRVHLEVVGRARIEIGVDRPDEAVVRGQRLVAAPLIAEPRVGVGVETRDADSRDCCRRTRSEPRSARSPACRCRDPAGRNRRLVARASRPRHPVVRRARSIRRWSCALPRSSGARSSDGAVSFCATDGAWATAAGAGDGCCARAGAGTRNMASSHIRTRCSDLRGLRRSESKAARVGLPLKRTEKRPAPDVDERSTHRARQRVDFSSAYTCRTNRSPVVPTSWTLASRSAVTLAATTSSSLFP